MRPIALVLVAFSLFAARAARADAAADVRDIRAGQLPTRHEWIGWDAAGHAHMRTLRCSTGGTDFCRAALVDLAPDGTAHETPLLDVVEVYCGALGPCAALDRKTTLAFEAAESRGLAAMPATIPTPAAADPETVLGTIAGDPTRVQIDIVDRSTPADAPNFALRLVARGKDGATETLGMLDTRIATGDGKVVAAYVSPDGVTAAFVVTTSTTMMCWDFQNVRAMAVNLPRRRASLANTIGFRAWKRGDMSAALAAFSEGTRHDPGFALAWYNRAAVESRIGAVTDASASFRRAVALEPKLSTRACRDGDFASLRGAEPGLMTCP